MQQKKSSLVEDFQEYFDLEIASQPVQMEQIYRIRYRVYCEEFGYESADEFPTEQETDQFDAHSVHCLVTHKSSGMAAGCLRLVSAGDDRLMPMENYCSDSLDTSFIDSLHVTRDTMCEFSRLAVDGAFRRRAGERATRFGELEALDFSHRERRTFPLIAVSVFISGFAAAELIGRPNCFAMMEPFLPRMLKRSGIIVRRAGKDTDYHGVRAPYFITSQDAVSGMPDELSELYDAIRNKFSSSLTSGQDNSLRPGCEAEARQWRRKFGTTLRGAA